MAPTAVAGSPAQGPRAASILRLRANLPLVLKSV